MAQVTITFTDADDGRVTVNLTFEPSLRADAVCTPAQTTALRAVELMNADNALSRAASDDDWGGEDDDA